ncbi:MAG: hypothetical protein Q9227_009029 [Pyrenula ochraceoflavens]
MLRANLLFVCTLLLRASAELNVVIYGGGVASGTLAQALKNYDHINVQYYDPALNLTPTSFRLLGLSPKVWTALDLIGEEAGGVINRAGWYPEDPSIVIMGQGPDAGKVILDYEKLPNTTHRPEVAVVDPAPYLMQMLNGTSSDRLHPNMTLVDIQPHGDNGPLDLTFQDGSKVVADVLIGDDGLAGFMRSYVLGPAHETTFPVFMNFLSAVGHVPPKEARKLLGNRFGDPKSQHRFERVGKGSWFLNAYLDGFFTCLGSFYSTEDYDLRQFTRETTPEELAHYFSDFKGGDGIVEVLSKYSGLRLIPEIEHPKAPTYVKGLVAMTGNAAHTMTNFQQLGPGQEIEDAMILGAVLGAAIDRTGVAAALEAYDETRRPRSQQVADHGKRLGMLWTGMVEDVGTNPALLREAFLNWKEVSESFDLAEHRKQALSIMAKKLQTTSPHRGPTKAGTTWSQAMLGYDWSKIAKAYKDMNLAKRRS